jgi:hypothetical protein
LQESGAFKQKNIPHEDSDEIIDEQEPGPKSPDTSVLNVEEISVILKDNNLTTDLGNLTTDQGLELQDDDDITNVTIDV